MVKGKRLLSILATAVILAMLAVAIPVIPGLAVTGSEHISVLPSNGAVDDEIEVEGTNFEIEDTVYLYFSNEEADEGDDVEDLDSYEEVDSAYTSDTGYFSTNFDVPEELRDGSEDADVTGGNYYVYTTYVREGEIVALDEFSVIGISLSPVEGTVGTEVRVSGAGFDDRDDIDIKFGSTTVDISRGDDETSSNGSFTSYFEVPESTAGDHTVTVEVNNDEGEAEFTVEPYIEIDPLEGAVGDRILVSGTGFARMKDVTITFGGIEVGEEAANTYGSFEAQVNVPEVAAGEYEVEAEDESNNSATATFSMTTEISISPVTSASSPGYVGDDLTISGSGFKPSSEITITYASDPVTFYTTSLSDGSFSYTLKVPPSESGAHTITAGDGINSMSVTFYMESTPPETPQPLLPLMEGKADSLAYFDWEDAIADVDGIVEQSLPITYQLQIATDENFTASSLVVNKTGLATSEYTLTEDEALEKTSKENPYYYWRIRAVDAASNAGAWTGAGTFSLGFSFDFDMSGWLLYVLIGVGALVLFFVGFWLGRRGGGGDYY
jgi:hypothetical protein